MAERNNFLLRDKEQVLHSKWDAMRRVLAANHPDVTTFCPILCNDGTKNHVVNVNSSNEKSLSFLYIVGRFGGKKTSNVLPLP